MVDLRTAFREFSQLYLSLCFAFAPFGFDCNLGQHVAKGEGDNLLVAVSGDKDRHKSLLFNQSPAHALAN